MYFDSLNVVFINIIIGNAHFNAIQPTDPTFEFFHNLCYTWFIDQITLYNHS